ncbi:Yip1 family protein [Streptomyces fuscigenes]|uniref:Yip1 family protein n=1 Tax=Streptomyces fuscigenes TaxID=1528880 RepID=UPI001F16F575|nr:Yip1 family protein [Streptomyces fuscigenes]MCF3960399.1 YIP1 family protein [Streptomyces fuscigenes]
MAGFRNGRGRDNRDPRQQSQPPYPQGQGGRRQQPPQWPGTGAPAGQGQFGGGQQYSGEPEYFGDQQQYPPQQQSYAPPRGASPHPYQQQPPHQQAQYQQGGHQQGGHQQPRYEPQGPVPGGIPSADPNPSDNNPGHTQVFRTDDPYGGGATYRAGAAPAPVGPRLGWRDLLTGIVMRPSETFLQMRDHPVWGPALIVTLIYGMLALFGFDDARDDVIGSTLSTAIPYVLITGAAFVIGGLILGAVTHTLARQLGGDGSWQPTVGLSMLIMSLTDAPRLLFAAFLGGDNGFVQILGWLTWLAAGVLMTAMVRRSHDLPWPKALGASAIELLALLSLLKLGTF